MKQLFLTLATIEIICSIFMTGCTPSGFILKGSVDIEKNGVNERVEVGIEEKL